MGKVIPYVSVNRRQDVIQQKYVTVAVDSPCKAHTGLLPARDVDPSLSNLRGIPGWEGLQVRTKRADLQGSLVPLFVDGATLGSEGDVFFDASREDPWLLGAVTHSTTDLGINSGEFRQHLAASHT